MTAAAPASRRLGPLRGLLPFVAPYKAQIALALLFLLLAASATLALPYAVRLLVDQGLTTPSGSIGEKLVAVRQYFGLLFGVAVALGIFTAARFFMVSWLGDRVTTDLRQAVYAHVLDQSPQFFETLKTGEVLSRLTTDTTVIQNAVGSSISMGLRNAVLFIGGIAMLVATSPRLMLTVVGIIALVVAPAMLIGRRVRRLSRASQDRIADSSAIAGEVLNAVQVVQSFTQERNEARRFHEANERAFAAGVAFAGANPMRSPRLLPGTDVKETRDSRAIYDVIQQWVKGMKTEGAVGPHRLVMDAPAVETLQAQPLRLGEFIDAAPGNDVREVLQQGLRRVRGARRELFEALVGHGQDRLQLNRTRPARSKLYAETEGSPKGIFWKW